MSCFFILKESRNVTAFQQHLNNAVKKYTAKLNVKLKDIKYDTVMLDDGSVNYSALLMFEEV